MTWARAKQRHESIGFDAMRRARALYVRLMDGMSAASFDRDLYRECIEQGHASMYDGKEDDSSTVYRENSDTFCTRARGSLVAARHANRYKRLADDTALLRSIVPLLHEPLPEQWRDNLTASARDVRGWCDDAAIDSLLNLIGGADGPAPNRD